MMMMNAAGEIFWVGSLQAAKLEPCTQLSPADDDDEDGEDDEGDEDDDHCHQVMPASSTTTAWRSWLNGLKLNFSFWYCNQTELVFAW